MRASSSTRMGFASTTTTAQAPARTSSVPAHPKLLPNGGIKNPVIATPTGTPVCLIENTKLRWCAGVVWISTCELAGVMGP